MARFYRFGLIALFLFIGIAKSFGGVEPYQNFIKGQLRVGDTLSVKDEKFRNSQFNWADISNISVKNKIELRVLQEQPITQNFDCQIKLRVEYFSSPQQVVPTQIQQVQLAVAYRVGDVVSHKLIDSYSFVNGYIAKIYITHVYSPQYGSQLPPILQLTNSILIDRQYKFNIATPFNLNGSLETESAAPTQGFLGRLINSSSNLENSGYQLKLEWGAMLGAQAYDVEWTPLDSPGDFAELAATMLNGSATESQVESIFRNNATRITTEAQSYVISLLYNSAYVVVRIRQVSYDSVTGLREEGLWHYKQTNEAYAIWPLNWHEGNLNWQFSASFAEEGKKKEVVSYFDGTLRNRQNATLNNTDNVAIVQENIYDEFGRSFMSILPAPHKEGVLRQYLHYFPNFNINHNASPTNFSFRDIGNNFCGIYPIDSLSNSSGAAKYYSSANPFANHNYVPDAKKYPFSLTQYTADHTGRVQLQGGVGKLFQPGVPNNKATRYLYGKPDQWELDRIFGNDVGYAEHYLKQAVIDANGQVSVSYTNASGKTIATALGGALPPSLSPLSSFDTAAYYTSTVIKPEQFSYDPATKRFTASSTYIATALGSIKLRYNINKLIDLYSSGPYHPCSNCNYLLKAKVIDDCNNVKAEIANPINIGSMTSNCNDVGLHTEELEFSVDRLGEYYISFEMSISDKVVESYVENYITKADSAGVLKKEFQIIKSYINELDFKPIFSDCRTAGSRLGSRQDFVGTVKLSLKNLGLDSTYTYGTVFNQYIDSVYTQLYARVDSLEANCNTSPCDAIKGVLITDVSPGGQYSLFDDKGNPLETSINILYNNFRTVFNVLDSSAVNYKAHLVTLEDGTVISPHDAKFTLKDLVTYWNPDWGKYFLNKHPEYCKVLACEDSEAYLSWDEKLTDLYHKESDLARISPGLQYSATNGHWLLNYDPFFSGLGIAYKNSMMLDLDSYSTRILSFPGMPTMSVKNLSEYVTYTLYCSDSTFTINPNHANAADRWNSCAPAEDCRVKDREWNTYKQFYLQLKQKYYDQLADAGRCSSAPGLACLPVPPYDLGRPGDPGIRDFIMRVDTIGPEQVDGFKQVWIKAINGPVDETRLIWFDAAPLKQYKALRNYVFMATNDSEALFYLPDSIPLDVLKIKTIQKGPFTYERMLFKDYFKLKDFYEVEGQFEYFYGFGLRDGKFPPNNSFDPFGELHTYANGQAFPNYGWGETDVYFKNSNNFYSGFVSPFWDEEAYVDGYVDYPVLPVGPGCPPEMANKVPRFPSGGGVAPGGYPSSAEVVQQGEEQLKNLIKSSCEANADHWMNALEPGLNKMNATVLQRAVLKLRLIEVCKKGGSMEYPTGTSTLPSGQLSILGDNSFGMAIKVALGISQYTSLLNPWVIDSPLPYGAKPQIIQKTISNSNADICSKIESLRPSGYNDTQLYNHLVQTYGSAMNLSQTEFNALLKSCGTCKYLISVDVKLPFLLEAGSASCITKTQYNTALANLSAQISGGLSVIDADSLTYTNIVSNYMNQTFGFGLSFDQYNRLHLNPNVLQLCNEAPYITAEEDAYAQVKQLLSLAVTNGQNEYQAYLTEERNRFRNSYISTCTSARPNVQLSTNNQLYHYTLYYYDQADNLVRTVPPEGVKFLAANQLSDVGRYRDGTMENCNAGPQENANKQVALQKLADILAHQGNAAVEQWLYKANGDKEFIATTPHRDFIFNTSVNGNYVSIDIYKAQTDATSITLTHSNHITANIASILPLQPWTHVVLQGDHLATGSLQLYVNGSRFDAVSKPLNVGNTWTLGGDPMVTPEKMENIKHLRLYTRLLQPLEILENANSNCRDVASNNAMDWYRFNFEPSDNLPSPIFPDHLLKTTYVYNSLNQVVKQQTPDAGQSSFIYDDLGRLLLSQNAKQALEQQSSYSLYDGFNRIVEIGQLGEMPLLEEVTADGGYLYHYDAQQTIIDIANRSQITQTYYDVAVGGLNLPFAQENLRKRVALTTYKENLSALPQQMSYYSYDLGGNVKTLGNYINDLGHKRLDYEYDLISGKVNFLAYQHRQPDAFYYKYDYDAENRLTQAWSATLAEFKPYGGSYLLNGRLDASYEYYLHGPLKRVELGDVDNKVQGIDYAYTLQGWLKGINGTALAQNDMGNDGAVIGKDVLAYSLGYYHGDYTPIASTANAFAHHYEANAANVSGRNLYNGNISHSTYAIKGISNGETTGYTYGYDQLNRLKTSLQHSLGNAVDWSSSSATNNFKEEFSYDANGNMLSLKRYNQSGAVMDNLSYAYTRDVNNRLLQNRLNQVANPVAIAGSVKETNYEYDAIGNLIKDTEEQIDSIKWTVYGKIKKIVKTDANKNISYTYDAAGNRVSKTYLGKTTYYVRDAQGNTLAVYDKAGNNALKWREQHLYGSSRLGIWNADIDATVGDSLTWDSIGKKRYELSNHLGNVMAVISDSRTLDGGTYNAQLHTVSDYYAFGSQMPGRSVSFDNYRYGFNGKENDNEVKGDGGQQDYGMRIYDQRIARFLSVDPITAKYPELTPYQFASNTPIWATDLDGLEADYSNAKAKKLDYVKNDLPWVNIGENSSTFITNTGISAYNGAIDAAELATNLNPAYNLFKGGKGYSKVYKDFKSTFNGVTNYLIFTPFEQQQKDNVNFLKNPHTWEDVAAAFATEMIFPKFKVARIELLEYKTVALGSSEGVWGQYRAAFAEKYSILQVDIPSDMLKTQAGRDLFWKKYNQPFLDEVINRNGSFKLIDDPNGMLIYFNKNPKNGLSFFGREMEYLNKRGYKFENGMAVPKKKD